MVRGATDFPAVAKLLIRATLKASFPSWECPLDSGQPDHFRARGVTETRRSQKPLLGFSPYLRSITVRAHHSRLDKVYQGA